MQNIIEKIKPSISKTDIIIYLIIFIGIISRISLYLHNRPFWLDECAILLNLVHKNNLFFNLEWAQSAPAFFLYISKFIYTLFPDNQLAMRFLPLIFSIGSIFAFCKLAKIFLKKHITIIIAIAIFTFLHPLVYYAQEFKQYSGDILFFILLLLTYPCLENIQTKKAVFFWGIFYSLMFYVSYASFFAEFGLFATLLFFNPKQFKRIFLILVPIIYSAVIFYICTSCTPDIDFLRRFWSEGFLSNDINKNFTVFKNLFTYLFQNLIILLVFSLSLIYTIKNEYKNKNLYLLIFPFLCAILLSYLKIYPLHSRISLFLVPTIILISVKWIDYLNIKNKIIFAIILLIFAYYAMYPNIISNYKVIWKRDYLYEDIRTPLIKATELAKENDIFIISYYNVWLYEYNELFVPIKNIVIVEGLDTPTEQYIEKLESYPAGRTYYWIEGHKNHDERFGLVYEWAKTKDEFFCQKDDYNNAVIRYRL